MARSDSDRARRLALTVLAPLGVVLVDRLPLPGVHPEVLAPFDPGPLVSLFTLGLNPAISAALLVEVLALVVPRWRPLRHGGFAGRARLERTTVALDVSLSYVGALEALASRVALDVLARLVVLCVALDVGAELRFRRAHGDVVSVRPEHRLYAVGPALARAPRADDARAALDELFA